MSVGKLKTLFSVCFIAKAGWHACAEGRGMKQHVGGEVKKPFLLCSARLISITSYEYLI